MFQPDGASSRHDPGSDGQGGEWTQTSDFGAQSDEPETSAAEIPSPRPALPHDVALTVVDRTQQPDSQPTAVVPPLAAPEAPVSIPDPPAPVAAGSAPLPPSAGGIPPEAVAAQITPALLTLSRSADGGQQMTLQLHPKELGMVQVRIDRTPDGAAHVTVTAERPETLQAITQAEAQLHHGLDNAGVPSAGRTMTFNLAPETQAAASFSLEAHAPSQPAAHGNDAAAHPDDGRAGGGRQSGGQTGGNPGEDEKAGGGAGSQGGAPWSQERWQPPRAETDFSLPEAETADQPEPA